MQDINNITKEENLPDNGKGFTIWVLMNYFGRKKEEAVLEVIDSPNDKKVDAFLDEEGTVKIIQSKLFTDSKKEVGESDIAGFKGCIDWLNNPEEVKKLNLPRFYDASLSFVDGWKEGKNVELHFFTSGLFSSGAKHERLVFNNSSLKDKVQMYFHDINDILLSYKAALAEENPLAAERVELKLIPGEYFTKKERFPSIVATIRGVDLLKMYEKYGDRLFERNIRFYRDSRKGSINEKIIDTALDNKEQDKFWYFNNGISFVCADFSVKASNKSQPILEVTGFQIINGCQTTVCLSEARQKLENKQMPESVQIIVRFIKAPVDEVDMITLYTNSQNPVSEIQLKSNCPIQKKLKEDFNRYSPPYFHSIKEGDWQKLSTNEKKRFKGRFMDMVEIAQALYSFTKDPVFARRYTIRLFSEKYYDIFKKDLRLEEVLLPYRILKAIEEKIKKYRIGGFNKLKKEPSAFKTNEAEEIRKKEFLIYSNLIILYFIGKLIVKKYRQYTHEIANKLLNKQLETRVSKLVDYIASVLKVSDKIKQETNLPRYFKNFANVSSLYEDIERAIDSDAARLGKDPLKDMLPQI